jgi:hypothetical protein
MLLLGWPVALRFVPGLAGMIVLVVVAAFLVQPATAHWKRALPTLTSEDVRRRSLHLAELGLPAPPIWHIRLALQHPKLLLVRLSGLHR